MTDHRSGGRSRRSSAASDPAETAWWARRLPLLRASLQRPRLDPATAALWFDAEPEQQLSTGETTALIVDVCRRLGTAWEEAIRCVSIETGMAALPATGLPAAGRMRCLVDGIADHIHWIAPPSPFGTSILSSDVSTDDLEGFACPADSGCSGRIGHLWVWQGTVGTSELDHGLTRTTAQAWEASLAERRYSGQWAEDWEGDIATTCCAWMDCSDPEIEELLSN